MRKILIPLLAFLISSQSIADEGMWLPHLLKTLNENEMQIKGLKITAEDIYSVNESSLKDAIVALNGGSCTAEMISSEGLMLTNHHCVDDLLQTHSTVENNYLEDGFWAMSKSEELKNENLSATFLISIEDVTGLFKDSLSIELSEAERNKKISEISKKIVSDKTDSTSYSARVRSFYGGNDFYLITYVTYKDVRLVGAPPSSIGKFGGDTDNWMWPRHTGDFALLRIYMAEDGSPADYSVDNIPYKPKHHLPIQLGGVENEDFTMIMGYPGRTNRYLTSFGVKEALEITYPEIIDIRTKKLEIMKSGMNSSKEIKLQYAAKYSGIANYWKYFIGQSKGLKSMKVYDKKVETENMLKLWIDSANTDIKEKYGNTMQILEQAYEKNTKVALNRTYLTEAIFQGPEILSFSYTMKNRINALPKDKEAKSQAIRKLKKLAKEFYKNYNAKVDENMLSSMLEMYYDNVPKYQHSKIFKKIENQLFGVKKLDFKQIHLQQNLEEASDIILQDRKHLENNPNKVYKKDIISLLNSINSGKV